MVRRALSFELMFSGFPAKVKIFRWIRTFSWSRGVLIPDFFVPPRRARERKGSNTKTPDKELSLYISYLLQKRPKRVGLLLFG